MTQSSKHLSAVSRRALLGTAGLLVAAPSLLVGCEDKQEQAKAKVGPALDRLFPLIERDTKQVRGGLPKGAELLSKALDDDPAGDPEGVRRAIKKARAGVRDLMFAKSTFFVFVEPKGVVVRGEADPDLAAGESLFKAIPGIAKVADAKAGLVEAHGTMHGLRGVQKGGDRQWVIGHPAVVGDKLKGALVTGWSYRMYANYLEQDARRELEKNKPDPKKPIPLVYVFLAAAGDAYGGPVTPEVNRKAVAKLDLPNKAKDGYQGTLTVEKRVFAVAAKPVPKLGPGVVLTLIMSEF